MAGHSKWANIKHRKGAQDAKRGKIFTKLIREITVAAKLGGAELSSNPRLRTAVDKALGQNMTKDTIERAIKRGAGGLEGADMEEVRYEGYGIAGVAVMVDCLTDNRNRTVAEVRHAFSKHGGNLGTDGSVSYLFNQQGMIICSKGQDEETIMELALTVGAQDVEEQEDGRVLVLSAPEDFIALKDALAEANVAMDSAEVTMLASTEVDLDKDQAEKLLRLVDVLEDLDDIQEVHTNAQISDSVLAELE